MKLIQYSKAVRSKESVDLWVFVLSAELTMKDISVDVKFCFYFYSVFKLD